MKHTTKKTRPLTAKEQELVSSVYNYCFRVAKELLNSPRYSRCSRWTTLNDVAQEGVFGAIQSAKAFNPRKNVRFITFANKSIYWRIEKFLDEVGLVRIPTRVRRLNLPNYHSLDCPSRLGALEALLPDQEISDTDMDVTACLNSIKKHQPDLFRIVKWRLKGETLEKIGRRMGLTKERIRQKLLDVIYFMNPSRKPCCIRCGRFNYRITKSTGLCFACRRLRLVAC